MHTPMHMHMHIQYACNGRTGQHLEPRSRMHVSHAQVHFTVRATPVLGPRRAALARTCAAALRARTLERLLRWVAAVQVVLVLLELEAVPLLVSLPVSAYDLALVLQATELALLTGAQGAASVPKGGISVPWRPLLRWRLPLLCLAAFGSSSLARPACALLRAAPTLPATLRAAATALPVVIALPAAAAGLAPHLASAGSSGGGCSGLELGRQLARVLCVAADCCVRLPSCRRAAAGVARLLPALTQLLAVEAVVLYFYAIVGVALFGAATPPHVAALAAAPTADPTAAPTAAAAAAVAATAAAVAAAAEAWGRLHASFNDASSALWTCFTMLTGGWSALLADVHAALPPPLGTTVAWLYSCSIHYP